jgi:hypothetical protein
MRRLHCLTMQREAPSTILDKPEIAGFYSQLTGVLAGFAFAGLVLVVTELRSSSRTISPEPASGEQAALRLLFSAFVGLVLTSLAYALVAGEPEDSSRASLQHVIAGAGFGAATLALLLALLELVRSAAPMLAPQLRFVVGRALPLVVMLYLAAGAHEVAGLAGDGKLAVFGWAAFVVLLILVVAVKLNGWHVVLTHNRYAGLATASMALPLAASLAVPIVSTAVGKTAHELPSWPAYLALVLALGVGAAFAVLVGSGQSSSRE